MKIILRNKPKIIARFKGGKGSGNFGHSGRPGKVGGSRVSADSLAAKGFYLESYHKIWLEDSLATLQELPLDALDQWEYEEPLTSNTREVQSMAQAMENGVKFPVIEVYSKGDRYIVADGQHRVQAMKSLGYKTIPAMVSTR